MIRHYDIQTRFEGGTVILEQRDCGELAVIHLADEQLLMLADKLRGIDRPSHEDQESRKLRVLSEKIGGALHRLVNSDILERAHDGQQLCDWLVSLCELADEFAFGLQPSEEREQHNKPQNDLDTSDMAKYQPAQQNASAIPETMPLPIL
jgi:hypothetical protein